MGQGWGFRGSNPLKTKAAKTGFEDAWVARLSRLEMEGPIALLIDDDLWRLWPGAGTADARHWRLSVKGYAMQLRHHLRARRSRPYHEGLPCSSPA